MSQVAWRNTFKLIFGNYIMNGLTGIEKVTYGVDDMSLSCKFFSDWGLNLIKDKADIKVLETLEKSQIILRKTSDPQLPKAIEEGPTVREVIWGVSNQEALNTFIDKISSTVDITWGDDGIPRCTDPNGLSIGFQVTQCQKADVKGTPSNTYDQIFRVDLPAPVYDRARPLNISHVVFFVEDLEAHERFYIDLLGFNITDAYPGRGFFSRCVEEGTHHNLFLLKVPNRKKGINHVSFMLRDIYEVVGGGLHFSGCQWDTLVGPGRHPISSAFFWYFQCPGGGQVEYYSDEDYLTRDWKPRLNLEPTPENYAEWAIVGGLDLETRRQKLT
jgi:catechol 2,3-dioxygenase-like lactoylglutathione lyase family enzyme